ncbi:MAG: lysophospholipid acyltransferase family protein [Pseudomonadota bacterium]
MSDTRSPLPIGAMVRAPRHWPLLFAIGLGWFSVRLSLPAQGLVAGPIGFLLARSGRIRRITEANIRACFPAMEQEERAALARRATGELARSVLETLKVWLSYTDTHRHFALADYEGTEHLEAALASGKGILLISCHYGALDLNGALFARLLKHRRRFVGVYRRPTDDMANAFVQWGRTRMLDKAVPVQNTREIFAELKGGSIVWFAPDLEVTGQGAVFAPFFAAPASTTTSPARLAGKTGAIVLPVRHERNGRRYRFQVLPPLPDFPTGDAETDAATINATIAEIVAPDPAPYWWCIKRFRRRPDGLPTIY